MLKPLKKLKRVPKKELNKALNSAFSKRVQGIDKKLNDELEQLNRSQERANTRLLKENEYLRMATQKLEDLLKDRDLSASESQRELSDLKATLSSTTIDLLRQIESERVIREEIQQDDNEVLNGLWAQMELLKEQIGRVEIAAKQNTQKFLTGPLGGGGSGGVGEIRYEGDVISTRQTEYLNFLGEDVLVQADPDNPNGINIYIPPPAFAITSFASSPALAETGDTIDDVTLNWAYATPAETQTITGPGTFTTPGVPATTTPVTALNATTNQTWTLNASDLLGTTDSAQARLEFGFLLYSGKRPEPVLDEALIRALATQTLDTVKHSSVSVGTSTGAEFIYWCHPVAYGTTDSATDTATNFNYPYQLQGVVAVENQFGVIEDYYVYRGQNATGGAFSLKLT